MFKIFGSLREKANSSDSARKLDDRGWVQIFNKRSPNNIEQSVLSYPTVFACQTLIQSDIGKLSYAFQSSKEGIWTSIEKHPYLELIRKPNPFQNHIQFKEAWINSKLSRGNTYVLKIRGSGGSIEGLIVLDPSKVTPLVSDSGEVFYELDSYNLAGINEKVTMPSTEIIHDRFNCLFHPLIGLSPIYACGLASSMGLSINESSNHFFKNGANPGGILTAPGSISDETANRLKEYFDANYLGESTGKTVVVGDGLKFEKMRMSNIDAQIIEHFNWTSETVCSTYHVPPFMVGVGSAPSYDNVEALNLAYYGQCLQTLIESMEECIGQGLELEAGVRFQLDLDGLLRMDQKTLMDIVTKGTVGGVLSPDNGRKKFNLPPVLGGSSPYLQQQNYSLEALSKRDSGEGSSAGSEKSTDGIQQTAMNGAQVTSLQAIIFSVANGELNPEVASAIISVAFPLITQSQIDEMINPYLNIDSDREESKKYLSYLLNRGISFEFA